MIIQKAGLSKADEFVLNQFPIAVVAGTPEEGILFVNPEAKRLVENYSEDGNSLKDFFARLLVQNSASLRLKLEYKNQLIIPLKERNLQIQIQICPFQSSSGEELFIILFRTKEVSESFQPAANKLKTLENILEHIPADVVLFDVNGRLMYLNQFSVKDEELRKFLIGKTNLDYVIYRGLPLSIGQRRQDYIRKTVETGEPQVFEEELDIKGKKTWHLRYMYPVKDDKGEVEYTVGYAKNIDREKQSETFNRIQSMALEETVDGIALLDSQGVYFYMNKSHANMYGYADPIECLGRTWHMLYSDQERARIEQDLFPQLQAAGMWKGITNGMRKDGSPIITEITLSIVPDGGLICVCRDLTEVRRQEMEMKRLALVASKSSSLVLITDRNGGIEWVNESFENQTGYILPEVRGKRPSEFLIGPDSCLVTQKEIDEMVKEQKPYSGDILSYFKSGKKVWLHLESTPVFNPKGELVNFICVSTDITLLKEAQFNKDIALKKERELGELKSRFVSLASHEFRTPLASILSSVEIIQAINEKKFKSDDRLAVHSERISSEVQRMTDIMNDILLMGKLEVGRINFKPEATDLVAFSNDQLEKASYKYLNNPITISIEGHPLPVMMDTNLMAHVFMNLISNAIKYSAGAIKGPELMIIYHTDEVELLFKDYGIGIPKNEQEQLFNSFFRASNTIDIQGTGLGLVIVKQFVEMHDGSVELKSEEGNGCEVRVLLPIK